MDLKNTNENRAFSLISHWLCYVNSAVNPIIYNFMSGNYHCFCIVIHVTVLKATRLQESLEERLKLHWKHAKKGMCQRVVVDQARTSTGSPLITRAVVEEWRQYR